MEPKITMFLLNIKGYYILQRFIERFGAQHIDCVVSSHDYNIENDYYEEIMSLCFANDITFYDRSQPYTIEGQYGFAIGWRWMIKHFDDRHLIVFHDSLLPRYRGFAPLVSCLINAETRIGVTALFASEEYDKGPIIKQVATDINYPIKISHAIDIIKPLYFNLVESITTQIINRETIKCFPQNDSKASYSLWRDEEDYRIDWEKDASYIKRFIDAVGYPYKGALTYVGNKKVRVLEADIFKDVKVENRGAGVGKVIFSILNNPIVVCGKGLLKIISAVDDDSRESILPLKSIRTRFR